MVIQLTPNEILQTLGSDQCHNKSEVIPLGYSIDSRSLRKGDCFIAIKGRNFDGHHFIEEAIQKGACLLIVSRDSLIPASSKIPYIVVQDTLLALQQLARRVRDKWGRTIIGVTGSTGKTTTKEITGHLLSSQFNVFQSLGNFNNDYGLPLSLLKLENTHEIAVLELGMSAPGEIARLSRIAKPDLGIFTNVGPVHLEFFPSIQAIAKAKRELIEELPSNGAAFLNNDDAHVRRFSRFYDGEIVTFGIKRIASYRINDVKFKELQGSDFIVNHRGKKYRLSLPLLGYHNISNCLPGIALAHRWKLGFDTIATQLQTLKPKFGRGLTLHFCSGFSVIDDSYNSNPTALRIMMKLFKKISGYSRKILVVGEMLEMGENGSRFHRICGKTAAQLKFDFIIGVQGMADQIVTSARNHGYPSNRAIFFEDAYKAGEWMASLVKSRDLVLVKGSRGVGTERVIQILMEKFPLSN